MMFRKTLCLLVGVCMWELVSCSISCPDGKRCSDDATCCLTERGYSCCPYPKAVCCTDLRHCCPSGYRCNLITEMCEKESQPWMTIPMTKKEAAQAPSSSVLSFSPFHVVKNNPEQEKSTVVHCDNYYTCPTGYSCCRHPTGVWFCCPYSPARCCLDGYHCCPYGYDCDYSYTHCVRRGLMYPFTSKQVPSSIPAAFVAPSEDQDKSQETSVADQSTGTETVIRCDSKFFCEVGTSCCKGPDDHWACCPYPLAQCCQDGVHCCQYGYTCDPESLSCRTGFHQIPWKRQERAQQMKDVL
ncbi:uncharacterized protein V6R79_021521 [Siganus canaliculatus]